MKKLDPGHTRHPLIDHEQGDRLVALLQLSGGIQRHGARIGPNDTILFAEMRAQVAFDSAQHRGIVVHCKDNGFTHNVYCSL